jgi:hypothetical protein
MARIRHRFYLAIRNDGGREILSLKFTPSPAMIRFSHRFVFGPYRTFSNACDALSAYLM